MQRSPKSAQQEPTKIVKPKNHNATNPRSPKPAEETTKTQCQRVKRPQSPKLPQWRPHTQGMNEGVCVFNFENAPWM